MSKGYKILVSQWETPRIGWKMYKFNKPTSQQGIISLTNIMEILLNGELGQQEKKQCLGLIRRIRELAIIHGITGKGKK